MELRWYVKIHKADVPKFKGTAGSPKYECTIHDKPILQYKTTHKDGSRTEWLDVPTHLDNQTKENK